ncbi:hypothetical protein LCGC14_1714130 [marine sediment metagenome]|uniref:Uncharacterized protein n=1 Tax=marine sediment metagenome TaxID=412755 RepID=A0A0F9HE22_9ZZZZ
MIEHNDWEINKQKIDDDIEDCGHCVFMKPCEWHKAMILGYKKCEEDFRTKELSENHSQEKKALGSMTHSKETADVRGCGKDVTGLICGSTVVWKKLFLCQKCRNLEQSKTDESKIGKELDKDYDVKERRTAE